MHKYFVSYRGDAGAQCFGVGDGIFELPRPVGDDATLGELKALIPEHHQKKYGGSLFGTITVVTLQHIASRP